MFKVPAAPPARRAPPWLWQAPLLLSALAILASAFRPWVWIEISLTRDCPVCDSWQSEIQPLTGAQSIYAPHFFALVLCLALCIYIALVQTTRRQRALQVLALGAILGWATLLPDAMAALRNQPRLDFMNEQGFGNFGGHNLFLAGMGFLALGLLLAAARLVRPARLPAASAARITPPSDEHRPPTPQREAGDA